MAGYEKRPAPNRRIHSGLHYKELIRPPARRKAGNTIFTGQRCCSRTLNFQALWRLRMTDRPNDLSSLPSYRAPRRSLFSARKFALMASVVAGLGVAVYGFSPSPGPVDIFSSPAHAQVNNEVRKVERPVGFADIVERVKPSVISVKINISAKLVKDDSSHNEDSPFHPGPPM